MKSKVFLDTAYIIALATPHERLHSKARELAKQIRTNRVQVVTTRAVLLEIGNALGKRRYRQTAVAIMETLENDTTVQIVALSDDLYTRAFHLYRQRPDKEWGLTDCISFVVMTDQKITEALTSDEHFQQAGFVALMRS